MSNKPILCLDFDGVLNSYESGWHGAHFIPDPPVPGAMQFLVDANEHFSIAIFSSRSHQEGGIAAMRSWLEYWMNKQLGSSSRSAVNGVLNTVTFPREKPSAFLTIDDRAITFTGAWPPIQDLRNFKPWNRQ